MDCKITILIVYVDAIILTGGDCDELKNLKEKIAKVFEIKELGPLKFFLGIEFTKFKKGIFANKWKYTLDLLNETRLLECKASKTPIKPNIKLQSTKPEDITNKGRNQRLVERLIYLSLTSPNIHLL